MEAFAATLTAASGSAVSRASRCTCCASTPAPVVSRRGLLQRGLSAGLALALAGPALAEERTYVEEYDNLVSATEGFARLSVLVDRKDWDGFRQALRYPPMSRIRSSGVYLYSSLAEGSQERKEATKTYKSMIAGVEKMDFLAIQAGRDVLKDVTGITQVYEDTNTKMAAFVAALPVPK